LAGVLVVGAQGFRVGEGVSKAGFFEEQSPCGQIGYVLRARVPLAPVLYEFQ
jgi:hypothetical protein